MDRVYTVLQRLLKNKTAETFDNSQYLALKPKIDDARAWYQGEKSSLNALVAAAKPKKAKAVKGDANPPPKGAQPRVAG